VKDDCLYLIHIMERIRRIEEYTGEGREAFLSSPLYQDAVCRNLEVIGEAAKHISDRLKDAHPEVPWRQITGLRDLLIHRYMGVDLEEVWNIVAVDLPAGQRNTMPSGRFCLPLLLHFRGKLSLCPASHVLFHASVFMGPLEDVSQGL